MASLDKITQDEDGALLMDGERIECYACFDRGYYVEAAIGYARPVVKDCDCQEKGEPSGEEASGNSVQQNLRSR